MLSLLSQFYLPLQTYRPTGLAKWNLFTTRLWNDMLPKWKQKNLQSTYVNTPGLILLSNILKMADIPFLMTKGNAYTIYSSYIRQQQKEFDRLFDPIRGILSLKGPYFSKYHEFAHAKEIVIPVNDIDHLSYLPFLRPYSEWKDVHPVTYVAKLGNDITTFDLRNARFEVHDKGSALGMDIFMIDTISLVMKYHAYCVEYGIIEPKIYLLKEVYPYLLNGLLTNFLHSLIEASLFEKEIHVAVDSYTTQWISTTAVTGALEDLQGYHAQLRAGNLPPKQYLSSICNLYHTPAIESDLKITLDLYTLSLDIAHLQQYKGLRYLRDYRWIARILKTYDALPNGDARKDACLRYKDVIMRKFENEGTLSQLTLLLKEPKLISLVSYT